MLIVMVAERSGEFSPDIHEQALTEALDIAADNPDAKGFLVIDLDDVRDQLRPVTMRVFNWILRRRGQKVPEAEETKRIQDIYVPVLGKEYYVHIWNEIDARGNHFKHLPLVDETLPRRFEELREAGFIPILWLTARPESQTEISRQVGVQRGLPDLPVYAEDPQQRSFVDMKTDVLHTLADALPGKTLYMIDDNANLILELDRRNHPQIVGIHYETPLFKNAQTKRRAVWATMLGVLQGI